MVPEHIVVNAMAQGGLGRGTVELAVSHRTIEGFVSQDELAKSRGDETAPLSMIDLPEAA